MVDTDPTKLVPEPLSSESIAFLAFHERNPEVYDTLVKLADEFISITGKHKLSIGLLWERARWELALKTKGSWDYELNDHLCPFYARAIMFLEEELHGVFDTRRAAADNLMPHLRKAGSLGDILL